MTTLIGIKTNVSEEAVVLASDTQLSYIDDDGNLLAKRPLLKIVRGDFWALAPSGAYTDEIKSFYNKLRNPDDKRYKDFSGEKLEDMINKTIEKKRFMDVDSLNANYIKKGGDLDGAHEFLMAVNKPKIELFHIDIFGNLRYPENNDILILGSGRETADSYIEEQIEGETYDSANVDISTAIKLCSGALKKSGYEAFSGWPMDLVIIRDKKIEAFGKKIKEALEQAEENILEEIIKGLDLKQS